MVKPEAPCTCGQGLCQNEFFCHYTILQTMDMFRLYDSFCCNFQFHVVLKVWLVLSTKTPTRLRLGKARFGLAGFVARNMAGNCPYTKSH